jgi:hypothetical protein
MSNSYARVKVTFEVDFAFGPVGDEWSVKELRERALKEAEDNLRLAQQKLAGLTIVRTVSIDPHVWIHVQDGPP